MSGASDKLNRLLAQHGPMSVAQFMGFCLADPEFGYYLTQQPFGRQGDFITAPEVSQMFGELLGAWCAHCYQSAGRPEICNIVELGPGRGTLMADLLRGAQADRGFAQSIAVHLVEISPALRRQQAQALNGQNVQWHADVQALPPGFTLIIANEFFDALPIQQFVFQRAHWHERLVHLNEAGKREFALGSPITGQVPGVSGDHLIDGTIVEIGRAATAVMDVISQHVAQQGGAILAIDYGYAGPASGDTLQAVKNHAYVDVLETAGCADLTAHVDFTPLAAIAGEKHLHCHGPIEQGEFLIALGLLERAGQLGHGKSPQLQNDLRAAVQRLAGPDQMGSLFKVLAATSDGVEAAGFAQPGDR